MDFHEIWYLCILQKPVEKIQVSLKFVKNDRYFTWRPVYIYDNIFLNSSENEKCLDKSCRENWNTHFMFNNCFLKIVPFWDNVKKYDRAGQVTDDNIIWHMPFACWITKATDTHSEYVNTDLLHFCGNNGFVNAPQCYVYMYIACFLWFWHYVCNICRRLGTSYKVYCRLVYSLLNPMFLPWPELCSV
jgi:hypothetical protein